MFPLDGFMLVETTVVRYLHKNFDTVKRKQVACGA
jgi:hypothetical protein